MINKIYDEIQIARVIKSRFGVNFEVSKAIFVRIPVSHTSKATLLLTTKKQLFLYIEGQSRLLVGDVKKIINHMGLVADTYISPMGRPKYFDEVARIKFAEVFPGRKHINNDDLIFYRTLVPYNPALVLISEVKDGLVYQFDSDATTNWRVATKFTYRRIKTS